MHHGPQEIAGKRRVLPGRSVPVLKACEQLASALGKEGARGISDLALFPETKARDLLAHAGMKELQQAALRLSWQVRSGQVCYSAEV
jgi:hypothetical protein